MHRKLTGKEIENKKRFEKLASPKNIARDALDTAEREFHQTMQNPVGQTITFDGVPRNFLHNGNLCQLSGYFCAADGRHLFDKDVQQLNIRNVCLKGYNNHWGQMPDGTEYIAYLIEKNPNIEIIDLSNTQLGNDEAEILLRALSKNTRLENLWLYGNPIDQSHLQAIQEKLVENRVRKIDHRLMAKKLSKFLDQPVPSVQLFKYLEKENKMIADAKKPLIAAHLDVMDEIKMSIGKR